MTYRVQKAARCADAQALVNGALKVADTVLIGTVIVFGAGQPHALGAFYERLA